ASPCAARLVVTLLSLCVSLVRVHLHLPPLPTRRSSDLPLRPAGLGAGPAELLVGLDPHLPDLHHPLRHLAHHGLFPLHPPGAGGDRKSTRLNSSHVKSSYAVFCLKKKISHPSTNHELSR